MRHYVPRLWEVDDSSVKLTAELCCRLGASWAGSVSFDEMEFGKSIPRRLGQLDVFEGNGGVLGAQLDGDEEPRAADGVGDVKSHAC